MIKITVLALLALVYCKNCLYEILIIYQLFIIAVRRMVNELKEFAGRALISVDLEEIFHLIAKRAKMTCDYRNEKKKVFKQIEGKNWQKMGEKIRKVGCHQRIQILRS